MENKGREFLFHMMLHRPCRRAWRPKLRILRMGLIRKKWEAAPDPVMTYHGSTNPTRPVSNHHMPVFAMALKSIPPAIWRLPERPVGLLLFLLVSCCWWPAAAADERLNPAVALPCRECHGDLTMTYRHPPVVEDCLNCHVKHFEPADGPFNLQDELNDLCLGCHDDPEDTGGHPVASHPTEGRPAPFDPAKPFTCLSCHTPHQSDMPALFRYTYDLSRAASQGYPCSLCHHRPDTSRPVAPEDPLRRKVAR